MKLVAKFFTIAVALTACNSLWGATFTYQALKDFTDIDAGEVPYYRHNNVNALAINAAIESYREKFARATLEFEESDGVYDVTITALGEIDGDGEFRILVDGEVVGSAVNEPVTEDFGEQLHTFENISIPEGALIGVESIAVSNNLIPEGDAYAFARGRWTTLTIVEVETDAVVDPDNSNPVVPDPIEPIDLGVTVSAINSPVMPGEELQYSVEVTNLSATVATNLVMSLSLPEGVSNTLSDICVEATTGTLLCELAELPANESINFSLTITADTVGNKEITAEVSADQEDDITGNNSDSDTAIVENAVAVDTSVDLQLTLSADKEQLEVGEDLTYTVTVINLHDSNTASAPSVNTLLPVSMRFIASDTCSVLKLTVTCNLEELPPGQSATAQFIATAVEVNSFSQLFTTVSSTQTESVISNNEAQLVTQVKAQAVRNIIPVADRETESSGGGGTLHSFALLIFLLSSFLTGRRYN